MAKKASQSIFSHSIMVYWVYHIRSLEPKSPSLSNLDRQGLGSNGTAKSAKQPSPSAFQPAGAPTGWDRKLSQ